MTPAVRALARRLGVDLSAVMPSGNEGQITAADVERAAVVAVAAPIYSPTSSHCAACGTPWRGVWPVPAMRWRLLR